VKQSAIHRATGNPYITEVERRILRSWLLPRWTIAAPSEPGPARYPSGTGLSRNELATFCR
jgi:hypothetical protein